jgi:hypothetical protein
LVGLVVAHVHHSKVLPPRGIMSPGRQLGTAVESVAGSAGRPSVVSSLNRCPAIRNTPSCWGRTAELELIRVGGGLG